MTNFSQNTESDKHDAVVDYARILRQIAALKAMTTSRGCTPAEAEVAARKIGEAVQRHDLAVIQPAESQPRESQRKAARRTFAIENVQAIAETDLAVLCAIDDEETWVPRSQIHETSEIRAEGDFGVLVVSRWFAEQRGWCHVGRK